MKVLALDLSTKTGYAIFDDGLLTDYGQLEAKCVNFNVNDYPERQPEYPYNICDASNSIADQVKELVLDCKPQAIVIENTVKGRNRHTQRQLEFIHKAVLEQLRYFKDKITYLDPSQWRSAIGLYMSKEDKKNNRHVSQGKKKGKITRKHLSVRMANESHNLELKLKDNDIADAICLGMAFLTTNR